MTTGEGNTHCNTCGAYKSHRADCPIAPTATGQRLTAGREKRIRQLVREMHGDHGISRELLDELDAVRAERDRAYAGIDAMKHDFAVALKDAALLDDAQKYLRELEAVLPDAHFGFSVQTVERSQVCVTAIGPDDCFNGPDLRTALSAMLEGQR